MSSVTPRNVAVILLQTVVVVGAGFVIGYFAHTTLPAVAGAEFCHTFTEYDAEILQKNAYGSAINLFSSPRKELVRVMCENGVATAYVGTGEDNQLIYKNAYERVDGAWKRVALVGDKSVGSWFVGSAHATLSGGSQSNPAEKNKIMTYVCQNVAGTWKCGCKDVACEKPYWQMQEYRINTTTPLGTMQASSSNKSAFYAEEVSPRMGFPGSQVVVRGVGFSTKGGNTIYLDTTFAYKVKRSGTTYLPPSYTPSHDTVTIKNVLSEDGTELRFSIPANLSPGGYRIWVENAKGMDAMGNEFRVLEQGAPMPVITSVTPDSGAYGATVTIHGSGFSRKNNDVLMSFTTVRGVPSEDGTTLVVDMDPFKNMGGKGAIPRVDANNNTMPITLYVANEGGVSENSTTFTLSLE